MSLVEIDENNCKQLDMIFTIQKQFPVYQKLAIFSFIKNINKLIKEIRKHKS